MDIFSIAGIELPRTERGSLVHLSCFEPPGTTKPTTSGRLHGARRSRSAPRSRVGPARSCSDATIIPFPLVRNASAVAKVVAALPHGYSPELNRRRDQELYKLRDKLASSGISKADAWLCAREVVHAAYIWRVTQAHKEAGIL